MSADMDVDTECLPVKSPDVHDMDMEFESKEAPDGHAEPAEPAPLPIRVPTYGYTTLAADRMGLPAVFHTDIHPDVVAAIAFPDGVLSVYRRGADQYLWLWMQPGTRDRPAAFHQVTMASHEVPSQRVPVTMRADRLHALYDHHLMWTDDEETWGGTLDTAHADAPVLQEHGRLPAPVRLAPLDPPNELGPDGPSVLEDIVHGSEDGQAEALQLLHAGPRSNFALPLDEFHFSCVTVLRCTNRANHSTDALALAVENHGPLMWSMYVFDAAARQMLWMPSFHHNWPALLGPYVTVLGNLLVSGGQVGPNSAPMPTTVRYVQITRYSMQGSATGYVMLETGPPVIVCTPEGERLQFRHPIGSSWSAAVVGALHVPRETAKPEGWYGVHPQRMLDNWYRQEKHAANDSEWAPARRLRWYTEPVRVRGPADMVIEWRPYEKAHALSFPVHRAVLARYGIAKEDEEKHDEDDDAGRLVWVADNLPTAVIGLLHWLYTNRLPRELYDPLAGLEGGCSDPFEDEEAKQDLWWWPDEEAEEEGSADKAEERSGARGGKAVSLSEMLLHPRRRHRDDDDNGDEMGMSKGPAAKRSRSRQCTKTLLQWSGSMQEMEQGGAFERKGLAQAAAGEKRRSRPDTDIDTTPSAKRTRAQYQVDRWNEDPSHEHDRTHPTRRAALIGHMLQLGNQIDMPMALYVTCVVELLRCLEQGADWTSVFAPLSLHHRNQRHQESTRHISRLPYWWVIGCYPALANEPERYTLLYKLAKRSICTDVQTVLVRPTDLLRMALACQLPLSSTWAVLHRLLKIVKDEAGEVQQIQALTQTMQLLGMYLMVNPHQVSSKERLDHIRRQYMSPSTFS